MSEQQHQSFQKLSRQSQQQIQSHRQSRHSEQLNQAVNHLSTIPHSQIVRDPSFRSSFGLRERLSTWLFSCFKCISSDQSYVGILEQAERRVPASISQQLKRLMADKILKLKICESSRLLLDPNVMHPFVKVHIVNKNTGCYIQNLEKVDHPAIYHHQELTSYNRIDRKYQSNQNDLLLPFATAVCDFRELGNSKGIWNQKFYIDYPANLLMNPDTLFLFEILDFNHQALIYRNDQQTYDSNNFYRVAWSFFRPVGMAKTHLGKVQLQLYQYKFNTAINQTFVSKSFIPNVYYDFLWSTHQKYEGYLTVQLTTCQKPRYRIVGDEGQYPTHLFEQEQEDKHFLDKFMDEEVIQKQDDKPKTVKELFKFYRNRSICQIPEKLIYKFQSQRLGCYRLKFIDNYIFAACSSKKNTVIKVFQLDGGEHLMTFRGHRGIIYKLQVVPGQKLLVTAGSDNMVRIWNIPEYTGEFIDADESEAYLIGECVHTAAVYSVSLIYQKLQDVLYILSCCFDGYLKLWQCRLSDKIFTYSKQILINDYTKLATKVYPCASTVSQGNIFIVGDSIGDIRIYDFSKDKLILRCLISPEEMKNDMILNIQVMNKSHLIIQAGDNLIRHYELHGNKLRLNQAYSGAVFQNQILNCAVSPDNKYLLAPSENGRPYIWDVFTGGHVNIDHLNLNLKSRLACCDWHPKYNLIALSGFTQNCPIFIYGNVLSDAQIKMVSAQLT